METETFMPFPSLQFICYQDLFFIKSNLLPFRVTFLLRFICVHVLSDLIILDVMLMQR